MSEYLCKCGRKVGKSSKADNTGNRETVGCDGCPYLMPWGEQKYNHDTKHFYLDVQGYECRMSPRLEYATEIIGRADDKCTMRIDSLDFDFLGRVQAWIKEHYPAGEISGDFNPELMRACQYISDGRYRMSIACVQNKAGMAAKDELMRAFFDRESKRRLDKTPEEEKQKILDDIERGKDLGRGPDAEAIADQDWEEQSVTTYKNQYGTVYAVMLDKHNHPAIMASDPSDGWVVSGTLAPAVAAAEAKTHDELQTVLDTEAEKRGWASCNLPGACDDAFANPTDAAAGAAEPTESVAPASGDDVCGNCVCRECDDDNCLQAHCDCRDRGTGCIKPDDDCRHDHPELFSDANKIAHVPEKSEIATKNAAIAAPETAPAEFDYSGMDDFTKCSLQFLALRIDQTRARAFMDIATDLKRAHDAIAKKGYGCFDAWCQSIGISKGTSFNMLRVATEYERSNLNERKVLAALPKSMLYAITSSNAPAEAVEAVKAGDVTTMPEYKALLAELDRVKHEAELDRKECENTNAQADRLLAERNAMNQEVIRLHDADRRAEAAERRAESIEAQRRNLQEAEAAHAAKIRELESRPVDVAVRKPTDAEIERYRQEGYAKAQKEFSARRDDESDFCETIADHAEAVADSCAEALAGWFRLAADIDDAAYAAGAEHIKALWLALREALQSGAWPTDDLDDDDDDEEYDPDDDDEENSDE